MKPFPKILKEKKTYYYSICAGSHADVLVDLEKAL